MPTAGKKGAGKLIAIIGGSVLVLALIGGGLFLFVIKGDLLGNNKKKREHCVNNIFNVYTAGLAFAQDNGERLPWQLTASGVRNHLDNSVTASTQVSGRSYSEEINTGAGGDNLVQNHPYTDSAAGVYGLIAMKAELVTPKILHSPCDSDRAAANELVQENWSSYDTKARGVSAELGAGVSYVLVRGADTQRPSSVYAVTRNWSDDRLDTGKWLGSNSDSDNERTMAKLKASQGQLATMDGGAKQSTNADCGVSGTYTKAAQTATGGVCRGRTSLKLIRGPGL
jgi:hypothetical protein